MTLAEFLLARIAEDEAVARAAFRREPRRWHGKMTEDDGHWSTGSHEGDAERIDGIGITIYDEGGHSLEQATHIARHDPARVLAEVGAKRRIVERHFLDPGTPSHPMDRAGCAWCDDHWPCEDLADIALPYADHPDYRQEWKP